MPFTPLEHSDVAPRRGFTPLGDAPQEKPRLGFTPLQTEPERPSIAGQVLMNNPLTAAGETALNLGSQMVALPVAGLAGLAAEAGRTVGLTEKTGADVVQQVGEALTYQPRGEMGKAATELATYPLQKLAEAGKNLGDKTLDATGSPVAATAVDTAVNALPMLIDPAIRATRKAKAGVHETPVADALQKLEPIEPQPETSGFVPLGDTQQAGALNLRNQNEAPAMGTYRRDNEIAPTAVSGDLAPRGFQPLEVADGIAQENAQAGVRRSQVGDQVVHRPESPELAMVRGAGDNGLPAVDGEFRDIPARRGTEAAAERSFDMAGTTGFEPGVRAGERGMGVSCKTLI